MTVTMTLWVENQPEGVGYDATAAYIEASKWTAPNGVTLNGHFLTGDDDACELAFLDLAAAVEAAGHGGGVEGAPSLIVDDRTYDYSDDEEVQECRRSRATAVSPPLEPNDPSMELHRRSKVIADSLSMAFGGRSQITDLAIGHAVAGQINNNGIGCYGTLQEIAASVVQELFGDVDSAEAQLEVVRAATLLLRARGFDASLLPLAIA
jgi:hypothetical protein